MLSRSAALCVVLSLVAQSSAHFVLDYPPSLGFDDDLEPTAPCGGFTPDFASVNVTDFHVGGDALAMTSTHPQANWLFRATLQEDASSGFSNLLPAVFEIGLGSFCESSVAVNSSWAGQNGVIQVLQDGPDGILYQCAAVSFVSGTATPPTTCSNATGLQATFTSVSALSSIPAGPTSSSTSTPSAGASTTPNAATSSLDQLHGGNGVMGGAFVVALGAMVGTSLLLL